MTRFIPGVLLCLGGVALYFAVFGGESYKQVAELKQVISNERRANDALEAEVSGLRREVSGLQRNPRALEKAARNEMTMAKPDEMVFIFEGTDK